MYMSSVRRVRVSGSVRAVFDTLTLCTRLTCQERAKECQGVSGSVRVSGCQECQSVRGVSGQCQSRVSECQAGALLCSAVSGVHGQVHWGAGSHPQATAECTA